MHAEETTKATLAIQPTLAVTLPNTVNFEVQPTAAGAVASGSATLSISTNNETGYSLYLSTADDDNALHSINPDTKQTITALTQENATATNFANNTWGYNLSKDAATDSTTYQSVPTTQPSDPQIITEAPTTDTYNLTFAAKVDSSLPSGTYTNTVTVSVVTNPAYLPPFEGIETMQEMTSTICSDADEGETARLKDTRDNKLYWVAKLKDGNCWMTQNLDLDLSTDTALTPDDSDVSADWTPAMSTQTTLTSGDFSDSNGVRSFDGGMYVNNSLTSWTNCNYTSGTCSNWTKVEDETDGTKMVAMSEPRDDGVIIDGNTYDAHYLAGNYYQQNAATAGTGEQATSYNANATDSICPKGWKLPTSNNSNSGSFGGLTTAYGIGNNSDGANSLRKFPLYLVPAGYVTSGSLSDAGYNGNYWSSTTADYRFIAYLLYFYSGDATPSVDGVRDYGQSVRCLAR